MTESNLHPLTISLHKQSKFLEIVYDDGASFKLPCEYLRVFSPSADVKGHGPGQEVLQTGKETVNIVKLNRLVIMLFVLYLMMDMKQVYIHGIIYMNLEKTIKVIGKTIFLH